MTVSAHDVAAVLRARLPGLGAKKLHKLLYYCQGHHLAAFDEPLFGETISAWDMGPVVGVLWHHEKSADVPTRHAVLTEAQLNTVGYVLSRYGGLSGLDLETLTHNETPWQRADQSRRPRESARIEQEWIREYFVRHGVGGDDDSDVVLDSDAVSEWLAGAEERRADVARPDSVEELRARLIPRAR